MMRTAHVTGSYHATFEARVKHGRTGTPQPI